MDVNSFKKLPLLGILRGIESGIMEPLTEAIISSGLKTIEITMNTKDAASLIKKAVKTAGPKLTVGAGTVLDIRSLKLALDSGATFIVMPAQIDEVLEYCLKNKIPAFPGALTPHEIYRAWSGGAAMVKVFPAKLFGPEYFKEIKAPFDNIELLACGGVTPDNLKDYFRCGASAVSLGASVFRKEWLETRDFESIKKSIGRFLQEYSSLSSVNS